MLSSSELKRLDIRPTQRLIDMLDRYRAKTIPIVSRPEAARTLLQRVLETLEVQNEEDRLFQDLMTTDIGED